jgi:phosphotransferase system  glucose/maltose/N-acetylglucosamine-specific IIC component
MLTSLSMKAPIICSLSVLALALIAWLLIPMAPGAAESLGEAVVFAIVLIFGVFRMAKRANHLRKTIAGAMKSGSRSRPQ